MADLAQYKDSGLMFVKIGSIALLALYFVYAFIIVKQVNLMTNTIDVSLKKQLKIAATAHLVYALALLLYAIIM